MTEEDQDSLRPTSPYHEKCFPPYCDNAGQLDKQVVSKMNRKELEDKYIVYADENLNLKKRIREHERQIQRLQTAMARQDNLEKKGGAKLPPSMQLENARVENLEMQNKNLQAKVKVLKQQLMNHSFIHTKENKIAENKEKNYKNPEYFRDVGQTQSARDSKHRYNSPSPSARDLNNVSALKERIAMLENMLETQKDKYKTRIAQLEKEVAAMGKSGNNLNEELNEHSRKVSDNVEIIKLRRDGKKLSKDIDILNDQNDALRKELEELKVALKKANESVAELERILEREREKARDAESNLSKSMSNTETIRALQEEIRDLKNERKELKEANEQLLLLTTTPPKSDRSGSESKLKQQVSTLELKLREKSKELEDMKREVARLEALVKGSDNTPKSVASKATSPAQKESDKNRDDGEKVEQLKKLLAEVQDELEELRAIADDHRKNVVQQRPKREWPDPKLVVTFGNKDIPSKESSRM
ncbi:myosin-11-like isoform X3 [Homalodisca vitripennis]|uniref:myosin-11-like isoform X3 n=1 Tax=Homalodisca vitripennis TaxID=197043 RepID=UPI001EE9F605|nr:myosin-11-like isoform X3 [Homalodisca vitripennis]